MGCRGYLSPASVSDIAGSLHDGEAGLPCAIEDNNGVEYAAGGKVPPVLQGESILLRDRRLHEVGEPHGARAKDLLWTREAKRNTGS